MTLAGDTLVGTIAALIDRIVPEQPSRDNAKVRLVALAGSDELNGPFAALALRDSEQSSSDSWVGRARPSFLYVMYAMILAALPVGLMAGSQPAFARNVISGISAYFQAIPDALYALFGTGYLGYTAARQWGKIAGSDR